MSSAETTKNGKLLKVHIIDPNTGDLDDTEGNFVVGLIGEIKEDSTRFTTIHAGRMTGIDILLTVKALKDVLIPTLLDSVQISEETAEEFFKTLDGGTDGNS